jgi:CheY-specific phosphatase CheX
VSEAPSEEKLIEIAARLLAEAAFVFVEPSQAGLGKVESMRVARVAIEGSEAWQLIFAVDTNLGRELAANLLGLDESTEEAGKSSADAVGEMANILAGALAVEFTQSGPCRIGIPSLSFEPGAKIGAALATAERKANLVTENGTHLAVALMRGGAA